MFLYLHLIIFGIEYLRSYELGDELVQLGVPLHCVPVLGGQGVEKGVGPVVEGLLHVLAAQKVPVVREALDAEEVPRGKGVKDVADV